MSVSLEGMTPEAIADLAALAKGLSENPKTRGQFLGMMKQADPNLSIPEVDIPARIGASVKPYVDKIAKLEREGQERAMRDMVNERRSKLVKNKGISESEIAEVEKLMVEKGIQNHDTAADFYLSQKQAAAPTPSSFSQPSIPRPDLKTMGLNINQWSRNEATNAIADIIKNRGRAA
jgi:hypothetical protein